MEKISVNNCSVTANAKNYSPCYPQVTPPIPAKLISSEIITNVKTPEKDVILLRKCDENEQLSAKNRSTKPSNFGTEPQSAG